MNLLVNFDAEPLEGFFLVIEEFNASASIIGNISEKFCCFVRSVFLKKDRHRQTRYGLRCLGTGFKCVHRTHSPFRGSALNENFQAVELSARYGQFRPQLILAFRCDLIVRRMNDVDVFAIELQR